MEEPLLSTPDELEEFYNSNVWHDIQVVMENTSKHRLEKMLGAKDHGDICRYQGAVITVGDLLTHIEQIPEMVAQQKEEAKNETPDGDDETVGA